jgi:hypothetical protein
MEIEALFGLPAHPLLVHAVVVLLPIAAVGTVLCALLPRWRSPYGVLVLGAAVASLVTVLLAQGSGEELEDQVEETELVEEHTEHGEQVLPWSVAEAAAAVAVVGAPGFHRRRPGVSPRALTSVLAVVALAVGAGAVYSVIEAGHSGSKAVWEPVRDGDRGPQSDAGSSGRH